MSGPAPDTSAPAAEELARRIRSRKAELRAVILAHYYQVPEIQDVADVVGDSLELARAAQRTDAEVIVFAGVHFMAETAKILNPGKRVLLPDLNAGCSLAESAPGHLFRRFRAAHPDHLAVTYINSTAEVKALSDIICTSSSAARILARIPERIPVLFAPDKNLGRYLARTLRRPMLLWQGTCTVHELFSIRAIETLRAEHPGALLLAHPECDEAMLLRADVVGSTSALLAAVRERPEREFIVATEPGILHRMRAARPDAVLHPAPPDAPCACNDCLYMKLNTLEKLERCMREESPELQLDEERAAAARIPIERMLALSAADCPDPDAIVSAIHLPFHG